MKVSKFAQSLIDKGIEIHFKPLHEDEKPENHFDNELESHIHEIYTQLDYNNLNYWFCASVYLTYKGLESDTEYLGCCSYTSFDLFTGSNNDYFDDMLKTCLIDLKNKIESIKNTEINF